MAFRETPIPNTIVHNAPPPLVEVSGTHYEMGCQIGEARREQVQHSIENAHVLIEQSYDSLELTWKRSKNPGAQVSAVCRGALSTIHRGNAGDCRRRQCHL